jgi:hypothetical protein
LVLLLNEVVAQLALGLKTITPLGTGDENALDVTIEPQKVIVARYWVSRSPGYGH